MRCPVCRADNTQGPQCRRCRADLSLLFELQLQRELVIAEAQQCLAQGRLARALALAEGAETLQNGADVRQVLAVIHLLRRDYTRAWSACQIEY